MTVEHVPWPLRLAFGAASLVLLLNAATAAHGPARRDSSRCPRTPLMSPAVDDRSLSRHARMVPETQDGHIVGVRLYHVAEDGLFARWGLQNGDLLQTMNGVPATPGTAFVLQGLKRAAATRRIELLVVRDGKPLSMVSPMR
jgi:S1-C subfamily serine protease